MGDEGEGGEDAFVEGEETFGLYYLTEGVEDSGVVTGGGGIRRGSI